MEQNMRDAAIENRIDLLYEILIAENPRVLEIIDESPYVQTPAHLAASSGNPHFAIEVIGLKPSFGKKLDLDGNGPVQVAIKSNQKDTVRLLVEYDPELLRVQGKMRSTPLLDYVAKVDGQDYDRDVLALFLLRCPKCIEDLNIRRESAVHVALKTGNMDAFMVLLGWLQQTGNLHVLDWEDENGDTALHVAVASTADNLKVVRLLIQNVQINKQNRSKKTALNIALGNAQNPHGSSIIKMLRSAGAKENIELPPRPKLSQGLVYKESRYITRLLQGRQRKREGKSLDNLSAETRSTLLVVAVLIITATYQAVLSPPGGLTSGSDSIADAREAGKLKVRYGKERTIACTGNRDYQLVLGSFSYSISAAAICPHATESSRTVFVIAVFSAAVVIYIGSLFIHLLKTYL